MLYVRGFLVWLVFLAVAVLAGAGREFYLTPRLGDTLARAVGSLFLCAAFLALMSLFIRRFRLTGVSTLLGLGAFWAALTLAFESGFGLWQGHTLEAILAAYNLFQGRLWLLVPLTLLFGPPLLGRLQSK
jgi:uncharacterized membrane protein YhaH (DUF805 family)